MKNEDKALPHIINDAEKLNKSTDCTIMVQGTELGSHYGNEYEAAFESLSVTFLIRYAEDDQ